MTFGAEHEPPTPRSQPGPRRTDTTDPRRARERALKILFQADLRGVAPERVLDELDADAGALAMLDDVDDPMGTDAGDAATPGRSQGRSQGRVAPLDGFTRQLVVGTAAERSTIDGWITRFARRWQIPRMPVVDRTVLRLATYELLHEPTPPAVVIDEAVRLATSLSTDDSGRFVNGVLESIRKQLAKDAAAPTSDQDPPPVP